MNKDLQTLGSYTILILYPDDFMDCPIIYTHLFISDVEDLIPLMDNTKIILVAIDGVDWDRDLSPWPAPRAFRGGKDFVGDSDVYCKELTKQIIPSVEAFIGITPKYRAIAGYSMAGLFAIYSLYRTDIFQLVACVSGSLWYDGFLEFMRENRPICLPERVYFSLGDLESRTKNQRLAKVDACTQEAEMLFKNMGVRTIYEINSGNHFSEVLERIAKGLRWLSNEL